MKLAVYGNCQAGCIRAYLERMPGIADRVTCCKTPGVHEIGDADIDALHDLMRGLGVLVYQRVSAAYRGDRLSSDCLLSLLPAQARTVSYPSLHFWPYFPNLLYLRDPATGRMFNGPGGAYHDRDILGCFIDGLSVQQAEQRLCDEGAYDQAKLRRDLDAWYQDMGAREATLDVKIADFLVEACRSERLFFVFNHPTKRVMFQICHQIASILGLGFDDAALRDLDEWLGAVSYPIHPSVHRALALKFEYRPKFNLAHKIGIPMSEGLERLYEYYGRNPQAVDVFRHKTHRAAD